MWHFVEIAKLLYLSTFIRGHLKTTVCSWFETDLDYKRQILDPKMEEFSWLVHKLSVIIIALQCKLQWKWTKKIYKPWLIMARIQYVENMRGEGVKKGLLLSFCPCSGCPCRGGGQRCPKVSILGIVALCGDCKVIIHKVEKVLKGSLDSISSPSPPVKIQIIDGKIYLQ